MPKYSIVIPKMEAFLKLMYRTMKKILIGITVAKQLQKSLYNKFMVKHTFEDSVMLFMVLVLLTVNNKELMTRPKTMKKLSIKIKKASR